LFTPEEQVPEEVSLAPGKEIELSSEQYQLMPTNERGKGHSGRFLPLWVGTGKVSVQYNRLFGNTSVGRIKVDPDLLDLTTGSLELEIKPAPPTAPGAKGAAQLELPAAKVPAELELPAAKVPAQLELPAGKVPAELQLPAGKVSVELRLPAAKVRTEVDLPAGKVPAQLELPAGKVPAELQLPAGKVSVELELPSAKVAAEDNAEEPPAWANKLFEGRSKEVAKPKAGEMVKHRFAMKNIYTVPLEVTRVQIVNAEGASYSISNKTFQPGQAGTLEVTIDPSRIAAGKNVKIHVSVGPQYTSTATLTLKVVKAPEAAPSAAFSPDGKRVVSSSHDGTVKVWNATPAAPSAAFSPDGKRVVSSSHDGTVKVWNATPPSKDMPPKKGDNEEAKPRTKKHYDLLVVDEFSWDAIPRLVIVDEFSSDAIPTQAAPTKQKEVQAAPFSLNVGQFYDFLMPSGKLVYDRSMVVLEPPSKNWVKVQIDGDRAGWVNLDHVVAVSPTVFYLNIRQRSHTTEFKRGLPPANNQAVKGQRFVDVTAEAGLASGQRFVDVTAEAGLADGKSEAEHVVEALAVQVDPARGDVWVVTPTEVQKMTPKGDVTRRAKHADTTRNAWIASLE
jgi:hypothetical protein